MPLNINISPFSSLPWEGGGRLLFRDEKSDTGKKFPFSLLPFLSQGDGLPAYDWQRPVQCCLVESSFVCLRARACKAVKVSNLCFRAGKKEITYWGFVDNTVTEVSAVWLSILFACFFPEANGNWNNEFGQDYHKPVTNESEQSSEELLGIKAYHTLERQTQKLSKNEACFRTHYCSVCVCRHKLK